MNEECKWPANHPNNPASDISDYSGPRKQYFCDGCGADMGMITPSEVNRWVVVWQDEPATLCPTCEEQERI